MNREDVDHGRGEAASRENVRENGVSDRLPKNIDSSDVIDHIRRSSLTRTLVYALSLI